MTHEYFRYEPLQPRHIRVLELESSTHPLGIISCRCIHVPLDDRSQKYIAVSYTWGFEQKPCRLLVNGRLLNITQNVHAIFQSKIMAEPSTLIWIDAICINQGDLDEKALQVRFMGEVFSNAERTRVWLGPSSQDSGLAISFIETLYSIFLDVEIGNMERTLYYAMKYREAGPEWLALAHLLSRPWFTRTWVIQEVALSTRADIVCGDHSLSWDTLGRVVDGLNELGFAGMISTTVAKDTVTMYGVPGIDKVCSLCHLRDRLKKGKPRPISWLMARFVDSETTERSDKIYSVLGIATDVADNVFSPDYTKPSEALFKDVTRFLITRDAKLDILRFASADKKPGGSPVPSWSFSYYINKIRRTRLGIYPVTTSERPDFWFSDDGNHLILRGFITDEVCQLGLINSVIDGQVLGEDETPSYYDWFCQAKDMFQSTEQDDEVFWRTLLANKLTNGKDTLIGMPENAPDYSWLEYFRAFQSIFATLSLECSDEEAKQIILSVEGVKAMKFRTELITATLSRRFCLLREGSVGLMPREARAGDFVAAFLGAPVLFAVRPLPADEDGNQQYQLVGECYVHDRMNGQVMELGLETKDIVLV